MGIYRQTHKTMTRGHEKRHRSGTIGGKKKNLIVMASHLIRGIERDEPWPHPYAGVEKGRSQNGGKKRSGGRKVRTAFRGVLRKTAKSVRVSNCRTSLSSRSKKKRKKERDKKKPRRPWTRAINNGEGVLSNGQRRKREGGKRVRRKRGEVKIKGKLGEPKGVGFSCGQVKRKKRSHRGIGGGSCFTGPKEGGGHRQRER